MPSLNRVELIGHLGRDPEVRSFQSGDKVANLRVATSEHWKDKQTGERKEATEWHSVAIFGPLADVAERYLRKGSKVFLAGELQTRKWQDQQGQDRYSTEVVLRGYDAALIMLDGRQDGGDRDRDQGPDRNGMLRERPIDNASGLPSRDLDDEIPF